MSRQPLSHAMVESGIVAVLRAPDADRYEPVIGELLSGGIGCVELTLTTPGTLHALPALRDAMPQAEIGVGTVLDGEDARAAIDAGARFLVTPCPIPEVIEIAVDRGVAVYPGAATPGEVFANWSAGATAVKLFPAAALGSAYLTHLRGPFPNLLALPSGGVGLHEIKSWLHAGAVAVSLGSPLIGDALRGGSMHGLRERVRQARAAVTDARTQT